MVKIRMKRMGTKKRPFYRIVVADSRAPRDGRFIEELGYYNPLTEPKTLKVDGEKVQKWISNGARPSDTVMRLLKTFNVLGNNKEEKVQEEVEVEKEESEEAAETAAEA